MAERTESKIRIEAPPNDVLDVIADVESYPEWTKDMSQVRVLSLDEQDWPVEVEFTVAAGVISDTYVLRYVWDVQDDGTGTCSWTLKQARTLKAMDGAYVLSADGEATAVSYELGVELAVPLPGMMRRKAEKSIVSTALAGLKKRVEG
ncbi:SRPBCC family protein [Gephyromycinifex aptenodytis]|uniref:SRPBCC family protein n=1 Tax=Gephyromycinifex aptenodytis TaxID=2716227 RepID=UPI001447FC23|nr:SRPBCC family protein [Gephyromycinifex aptenodytis]